MKIKWIHKSFMNLVRKLNQKIQKAQIICWFEQTKNPERVSLFSVLVLNYAHRLTLIGASGFVHLKERFDQSHY